MVTVALEEAAQSFFRHVGGDGSRKQTFASRRQRPCIKIGGENLKLGTDIAARGLLDQQDSNRVGFLSRRTPRYPDADMLTMRFALEQGGDNLAGKRLKSGAVAEESRDGDQQIRE